MNCRNASVSNQKGQATTIALIAVAVTTSAVLFMMDRIINVERDLRYPRIKAQQTIQKVRLTTALNLPMMYQGTGCNAVTNGEGQPCDLTNLGSVLTSVKGADCGPAYASVTGEILPPTTGCGLPTCGCGFSIRPTSGVPIWNSQTRKFNGLLHYMGKDISIADTLIEFNVPGQLLTGDITICPADKPQFQGFDNVGAAICVPFAFSTCPAGQFVTSIHPVTFAVTCQDYTSTPNCGIDSFFTSLTFDNGKYSGGCTSRLNPFLYYDYNPENSVSSQPFVGPTLNAFSTGDYDYYTVFFDSPTIAPPPTRTCDAVSGPW